MPSTTDDGGGIANVNGTLTLNSSTVSDNTANDDGGGIYHSSGTANLTNSTVSGNTAPRGGGIHNDGATLTMTTSTVNDNTAGIDGGGIFNIGTLTMTNSTVSGNTSTTDEGGGIYHIGGTLTMTDSTVSGNTANDDGGGIYNKGTLTLTNSTISGNTAGEGGGGIWSQGTLTLTNSTISGNSAGESVGGDGGGIANLNITELVNTIIAGNTAFSGPECVGSPTSLSHNLIGDGTGCGFAAAAGDLVGNDAIPINPLLGLLRDNGGPTETHALSAGSPAIDAGDDAAAPDTDQRGVARPEGPQSDIGAFEAEADQPQTSPITVNKTDDTDDGFCGTLDCSLREAIGSGESADTINIPMGVYTLTLGTELVISRSLNLMGAGADSTIIQAATELNLASARVFHVMGGQVAISNVTIRHGNPASSVGGVWNDGAELTLTNTVITRNGGTLGGVLNGGGGTLTISSSTVSDNSATADSGGVLNSQNVTGSPRNTLTVVDSTISGNNRRGLWNGGTLTVTNSTISGNSTVAGHIAGAGIYNFSCCGNQDATATVVNSTITGNTSPSGTGGIFNNRTMNLANTIVADNIPANQPDCNSFTSLGHNLIGNSSGCAGPTGEDVVDVDALLGLLQNNGGPTETHELLSNSPAIDAGDDDAAPETDQRGVLRPQGPQSDIGAYEAAFQVKCRGLVATQVGAPGADIIVGTSGDDVIVGLAGDDIILGLAGNDRICAGPGEDVVRGGSGRDRIYGEGSDDTLLGGPGKDRVIGGGGDDVLRGGGGNDVVSGGAGHDLLAGGSGNDRLVGGGGDDAALGGGGDDAVNCGPGADFADGGAGTDTARVNCEVTARVP